jgi:hypothetical protein
LAEVIHKSYEHVSESMDLLFGKRLTSARSLISGASVAVAIALFRNFRFLGLGQNASSARGLLLSYGFVAICTFVPAIFTFLVTRVLIRLLARQVTLMRTVGVLSLELLTIKGIVLAFLAILGMGCVGVLMFAVHYQLPPNAVSRAVRADWIQRIGDYRLFCVCEINDNLLLWAQYTASHTGAVFQFECIKELDVPLLAGKRVRYSDEAPGFINEEEWIQGGLGLRAIDQDNDVWMRLVTTKARVWEHEKEWRVISKRRPYENEGYDCRFVPREISKIFLGCKMSEADKSDILQLLSGPFAHVAAYQAMQNPLMFRLDFERVR